MDFFEREKNKEKKMKSLWEKENLPKYFTSASFVLP